MIDHLSARPQVQRRGLNGERALAQITETVIELDSQQFETLILYIKIVFTEVPF